MEIMGMGRKMLMISIRTCNRLICNHPFLVGMLCVLVFLHRYFPFLFSFLVSASPVLACTAVLLGTLLSFGQPNVPEIEEEKKDGHVVSSLQTTFLGNATLVNAEKHESFALTRYDTEKKSDLEERGIGEASLAGGRVYMSGKEDGFSSYGSVIDEHSQEIQNQKQMAEGEETVLHPVEMETNSRTHEDDNEKQYVMAQTEKDQNLEMRDGKLIGESSDSCKEEDHAGSSSRSSWKGEEDEDDHSLDSGSDNLESSSPDASVADFIPIIDELHPLLDSEDPQPAQISHDDSEAASEQSHLSDSVLSDEEDIESDNQGEAEDGDNDEEDEEETQGSKEDESKSAIKWTEDDQKNLVDLGTLELERNQRLENLIARRRARTLRSITEKNLIDLDGVDLPFNIAPVATKHNPFDFPDDSHNDTGLPPAPGSAPSILQPRKNPFDLPYDSSEDKPDRDSFHEELMMFNQKDPCFRRLETFNYGPSGLGAPRQEGQDIKWKPIFIPEQLASEGASYSALQRQSSEASDSKLSSIPDIESVSSTDDEQELNEKEFSQGEESISNAGHISHHDEHESQSSGDIDSESIGMENVDNTHVLHAEPEITLGRVENQSETKLDSRTKEAAIGEELDVHEIRMIMSMEPVDRISGSSHSSQSGVIDNVFYEKMEESESLKHESRLPTQPSLEVSDFQSNSGEVEDNHHQIHTDPIYDSSPHAAEKISFPSNSSDTLVEMPDKGSHHALKSAAMADKESEKQNDGLEVSPNQPMENESESMLGGSKDINDHDVTEAQILSTPLVESAQMISISTDGDLHVDHDVHQIPHNESSLISECPEGISNTGKTDVKVDDVPDRIETEDHSGGTERFKHSAQQESQVSGEYVTAAPKMKEIDKVLLSQSNAVNDFNIRDVCEPAHPVLMKEESTVMTTEAHTLPKNIEASEKDPKLPILEA